MKKIILVLSILCVSLQAQEKVLEIPESFKSSDLHLKQSYAISNQITNDLVLLLEEKETFNCHLFSSDYKLKKKINARTLLSKYNKFLGYNVLNKKYSLFYSTSKYSKIIVLELDFDTGKSSEKMINFGSKNERYLESVNFNNTVYILTVTKNSSDINIYTYNEKLEPVKKTISLNAIEHANSKKTITAYDLLFEKVDLFKKGKITKIEPSNLNVIETTSKKSKLYSFNADLVMSFDFDIYTTSVFTIDLNSFTLQYQTYDKPLKEKYTPEKSNSYIFDAKIFQIASAKGKMAFTVRDLTSGNLINTHRVTQNQPISFKNQPLMIETDSYRRSEFGSKKRNEAEKTSMFLKEISKGNLGISVSKLVTEYTVVLGGSRLINNMSADPTVPSSSYIQSTYMTCMFDENFEHIDGETYSNTHEILYEFEGSLPNTIDAINIFMHSNILHYNYFDYEDRIFKLYKFEE